MSFIGEELMETAWGVKNFVEKNLLIIYLLCGMEMRLYRRAALNKNNSNNNDKSRYAVAVTATAGTNSNNTSAQCFIPCQISAISDQQFSSYTLRIFLIQNMNIALKVRCHQNVVTSRVYRNTHFVTFTPS